MTYLNKNFLFVRFPIFLPIIYFLILKYFPDYELYLIATTIFLLAEPHFAATWPIFLNKVNYSYIIKKKFQLIYGVIFVCLFSLYGFFKFQNTFLLIFFFANIFHVTRQSVGILKLYNKSKNLLEMINILYFFGLLYFFIGLMRFYTPIILDKHLFILNMLVILTAFIVLLLFLLKKNETKDLLTFLSGLIIFYPICFVDKPVHAILMGVTIHYSQYLYLTYLIDRGRNIQSVSKIFLNYKFIFIIFIYAGIMTLLTLLSKNNSHILSYLIIIPITGQMLHFYIDSFIWRFSESHNREVSLKYINP